MKVIELEDVSRKFIKREDHHITKRFKTSEEFWALKHINFQVDDGEILGVIGRNGSGKTTLLKIIAGIIPPTKGNLKITGEVSSLLTLGAGFQEELSGRENIYLNSSLLRLKKDEIKNKFDDIVKFSELGNFIDEPLGGYSDGMKMRLGFSIAIHVNFEILIIDEVIMVGDLSFQEKCFKKLVEFKEQGKTMVVSTQATDVINKLSDKVILLEEGKIIFNGGTSEGINRYLKLLNEKKFLGHQERTNLVKNTKKWATDMDKWGGKEGNKEVEITKIKTFNRWYVPTSFFSPGSKIIIKVNFNANKKIKDYHFGVALFREDGVYCYGPNSKNDGYELEDMNKGKGSFILRYKRLLLNAGTYFLSVVIWDKNETFAYNYHRCCYKIKVTGKNKNGQLLKLDSKIFPVKLSDFLNIKSLNNKIRVDYLENKWGKKFNSKDVHINDVKLMDKKNVVNNSFFTNKYMEVKVSFKIKKTFLNKAIFWIGLFREDGIYCHGTARRINLQENVFSLVYKNLKLLPGNYNISIGFWDIYKKDFIYFDHGNIPFNVSFTKEDHGTVYLDHNWKWELPKLK